MAEGATRDLREAWSSTPSSTSPTSTRKNFVRKHLLEGFDDNDSAEAPDFPPDAGATVTTADGLAPGEMPPYDAEAT